MEHNKNQQQVRHRPGAFKQTNKQHKTGRHRSKGSISNEAKGKQNIKLPSRHQKKSLGRDARRHQLAQIRKQKRETVLMQKRNLGGLCSAPILICVIPLQTQTTIQDDIMSVLNSMDDTVNVTCSPSGVIHIGVPRFKQRFSIVVASTNDIFATLDAAKVATTILFVTSCANDKGTKGEIMDDWGREIFTSCLAQGLPATVVTVHNIQELPLKKRQEYKQSVQHTISKWLPEEKVLELDTATDYLNMLRRVGSQKQKYVYYQNKRPHLLAEKVSFECDEDSSDYGTLTVTGYLQGAPLSVNGLVHITGLGDYQMSRIEAPEDPYPIEPNFGRRKYLLDKYDNNDDKMEIQTPTRILEIADSEQQESLISENIPDPMDAEQTWPTEEELAEAAATINKKRKVVKRVPKGTSEYQAAWILDEDAESFSGNSEDEDNMCIEEEEEEPAEEVRSETASDKDMEDDEEYETMTISEVAMDEEHYDKNIDALEEKQIMEKIKEAKLDAQFPDEVDTPQDILAKTRFQKYRGLESFRTSPWDTKENLPTDYSRIFQFENFDRTRKRIFKERKDMEGVMPGWYIAISITRVDRKAFKVFSISSHHPLIVLGLLPNENKMSVLNMVLKHSNNYTQPIKSKEKLIFQCGFRRFTACPMFSQHTNGTKHKYERYFHPESTIVASVYAPITFPSCPILCYKENKNNDLELVAVGNVLSCNPDRIVVKRVILSGHPYKVNKRSAVIRFMFHYREDIEWFKPVQLRTKYGRRGHIKEPLGTHGHMKCVFNGQLKSQDTVLMNLYKRVFPKWTYQPLLLKSDLSSEMTTNT